MALAALSPENQINGILRDLDCAVTNFAGIVGRLSGSRVAAALSGQNDFSAEDGQYHLNVARSMRRLQDDYQVPIDWRRVERLKEILGTRKAVSRPFSFAVILIGSFLFKKMTSDGRVETTTSYQDCAAFSDLFIARTAAKILDDMGQMGLRVTSITNEPRAIDTIAKTLQDVGFIREATG
jgi:hypothetical protein